MLIEPGQKRVGIIGTSEQLTPKLQMQLQPLVDEAVKERIVAGQKIVVKATDEMAVMVITAVMKHDPELQNLTVIVPTSSDTYRRNARAAALRGYANETDDQGMGTLLQVVQQVRPGALVELNFPYLCQDAVTREQERFMAGIDDLHIFSVGVQSDGTPEARRLPPSTFAQMSRVLDRDAFVTITDFVS